MIYYYNPFLSASLNMFTDSLKSLRKLTGLDYFTCFLFKIEFQNFISERVWAISDVLLIILNLTLTESKFKFNLILNSDFLRMLLNKNVCLIHLNYM